ncbi:MAG: FHA domain-containing protein, partial [Chloroflexota bacterium]
GYAQHDAYAQPPPDDADYEQPEPIGEDMPTPPPEDYGQQPPDAQPYDAGYAQQPSVDDPYDAYAQPPPDDADYAQPEPIGGDAPTPPPDYEQPPPSGAIYSTGETSILDADSFSTPVPGNQVFGSPDEYREYRQAAIAQEEEFITEIETSVMPQQIATNLPLSVPAVERSAYQRDTDCLAIYSYDHSYIVELPESQSQFQIGREPKDDIFLEGDLISRDHAVLERKPNGFYYLIDGDSTNGTYIGTDQLPANKPIILREGTTIRMGNYWMQLLPRMSAGSGAVGVAQPYDDDYSTDAGFDPVADGPATQLSGFIPVTEMPKVEPPRLTGEQLMTDRLVIYHKSRPPQIVLLNEAQYVIGRAPDNDIILPENSVSRRHAVIDRSDDDFFYIRDLNTLNGTWFEQERLEANEPHRMNASRVVRIGESWITFEAGRAVSGTMRSTGGGIRSDALAARGLSSAIAARDDAYDDSLDTVAMVRPLEDDIPPFSMPPLSDEMRASDRLIFISEDHPIQIEKLDKEILTIGRASNQDIRLRGRRISREHLVLELRADGNLYLTDTDSRNGTWVGSTLAVPQTLIEWKRHETLRIANYWVRFERGSGLLDPFVAARMDPRGLTGRTVGTYRIDRYIGETELSSVY